MKHQGKRSVSCRGASLAVGLLACAACATTTPFARPKSAGGSIVNEATGHHYTDCKAALAEATADTVLTFSAGLFHCGPELTTTPDWLVVRGAGMGETFLDAAQPGATAPATELAAFRVRHSVRIEDLSFGGISATEGDDAHVTLLRVAVATNRPAIVGGTVTGGVLIIHSVVMGWLDQPPATPGVKPLAVVGNERVAAIESLFFDVEQEFERYQSPGSVVVLSPGAEDSFSTHLPAARQRPEPSRRPNVPCGNTHNPTVFCERDTQAIPDHDPMQHAAALLAGGAQLSKVEETFRGLAAGFADRFRRTLGAAVRQPDVYWFDDSYAQALQQEAAASPADAVGILARSRLDALVDRCRSNAGASLKSLLESAAALDGLMKSKDAEDKCKGQLKEQADALVAECKTAWDWDRVVERIANADSALEMNGELVSECRKALSTRLPTQKERGPLVDAYVRSLALALKLDFDGADGSGPAFSLVGVVGQLPAVTTRSDRPSFNTGKSDILDRMIAMAQVPGAGDGRHLVETTEPCKPSGGAAAIRATTVVTLGELPPRAKTNDVPRTVFELPIEATRNEIPAYTSEGNINVELVKQCDEKAAMAYRTAVRRYVIQELSRLSEEGPPDGKLEAEAGLQLIRADHAEEVVPRTRRLPMVESTLAKLSDTLRREPLEAAPIARGVRTLDAPPSDSGELPPPPDWTPADFVRAADVMAGAHVTSTAACKTLLPDVPWQTDGSGVSGGVVLASAAVQLRCEPGTDQFELTLLATKGKFPAKILAEVQKALAEKLGPPKAGKHPEGPASLWAASDGHRSGYVLKKPAKAGHAFSGLVVPVGSSWPDSK